MKKRLKLILSIACLLIGGIAITHTLTAQTGGMFDLTWSSTDNGGGGVSSGGNFAISDTIAQPSGSNHDEMTGGAFVLTSGYWSRQLDPALAVTLESFTAEAQPSSILLRWVTVSEVDNLGFNLYRADTPTSEPMLMNPELIPSQSPGGGGASYEWADEFVIQGNSYFYWLESLGIQGNSQRYGPVSATFIDPTALTLTGITIATAPIFPLFVGLGVLAFISLYLTWRYVKHRPS